MLAARCRQPRPTGLEKAKAGAGAAPAARGAVAQLGERLICIQEVVGSNPISSTSLKTGAAASGREWESGVPGRLSVGVSQRADPPKPWRRQGL